MILDEAIPAVALQCLGNEWRHPLASPVFRDGRRDAADKPLRLVRFAVEGERHPKRKPRSRDRLDLHVRDDVGHERLIHERTLERAPVRDVVSRLRDSFAHDPGGRERAFQPRKVAHRDRLPDAAALLPDQLSIGASILDLRGRVGPIASLFLEALEHEVVARAVGQPARDEEAGYARFRPRESDEEIGVRSREEPLVAHEPPALAIALRHGLRLPQVRASLLLRHGHADGDACLRRRRDRARIVAGREHPALPLGSEGRIAPDGRDRPIGHEDGAHDSVLAPVPKVREGGSGDLGTRPRIGPGQRVDLLGHREPHQLVPGRVEVDLVDPVAETVVRPELGRVAIGLPGERPDVRAPDCPPCRPELLSRPVGPEGGDHAFQRRIRREGVELGQWRGLVQHLVGGIAVSVEHRPSPAV